MVQTILTSHQKLLLKFLSQEKDLIKNFYLTGGTALAEYYLHHRYSEDLDFFSFKEVDPMGIQIMLNTIKNPVKILKIDFQKSFNRNLFFLYFKDEIIKAEFTYYPFLQLEKPKSVGNLKVDSLMDIAANKIFTVYQNPSSRHFVDLYLIIQKKGYSLDDLIKKAKRKFDTYIDPLQMAQQLIKITELKDYPKMIIDVEEIKLQQFWLNEIKKLKVKAVF